MKKQLLAFALIPSLIFGAVTVPLPKAASAATTGEVVSSVSFRQSPNVNSPRIRYLKKGEPVSIIEKVNAYWYRVQVTNGQIGYVSTSSKYIKASGQSTTPANGGGTTSEKIQKVIAAGKKYIGTPYEYGSSRD